MEKVWRKVAVSTEIRMEVIVPKSWSNEDIVDRLYLNVDSNKIDVIKDNILLVKANELGVDSEGRKVKIEMDVQLVLIVRSMKSSSIVYEVENHIIVDNNRVRWYNDEVKVVDVVL